jgi:hypothetical protein
MKVATRDPFGVAFAPSHAFTRTSPTSNRACALSHPPKEWIIERITQCASRESLRRSGLLTDFVT